MAEKSDDTIIRRLKEAGESKTEGLGLYFIDRKERSSHHSWKELYNRSKKSAGALLKAGVKPGDRVAIILPTCVEFMDAFFGCQQLGAIPIPLYPPVRLGKLDEYFERTAVMLQTVDSVAIITNGQVKRILGQLVARYKPAKGLISAETLHKGEETETGAINGDTLAMAQFSSGTTQNPKPVGLTHRQILANVDAIIKKLPLDTSFFPPTGCSWLPLYHDMGLIGCLIPALAVPGRLALIPPEVFLTKPAIWLRTISKYKAMISPAPNFAYAICTERIKDKDLKNVDLSNWKMALNGAEPVASDHLHAFIERFKHNGFKAEALTPVYGLAEAALAVTFSDSNTTFKEDFFDREKLAEGRAICIKSKGSEAVKMVSVGKTLPGFFVEIREKDGRKLPSGAVGKIWVKGPSIMSGYLNDTPSPVNNGWLDTGDLGFLHQEELYISGRDKDVLILRGQNHAPAELEQAVDSVPGVRKGCSVAVSQLGEEGEKLFLFVECKSSSDETEDECRGAVLSATGIRPDHVVILEPGVIPRTSSGKLKRRETLNRFIKGELLPPKKMNTIGIAGALAKSALGYIQARQRT